MNKLVSHDMVSGEIVARQDDFGELRSLLDAPGSASWDKICALLGDWSDRAHLRDVVTPYCESKLRSWPDHVRRCPASELTKQITHPGRAPSAIATLSRGITIWAGTSSAARLIDAANAECFRSITSIEVIGRSNKLDRSNWRELLDTVLFTDLRALRIFDVRLDQFGLDELLDARVCEQLESLHLERCRLNRAGFEALCSASMPSLRTLDLRDNNLRVEHFRALSSARGLASSRRLYLGARPTDPVRADNHKFFNRAERAGLEALVGGELNQIEALELTYHQLDQERLDVLLADGALPNIEALDLGQNYLGKSIPTLCASGLWKRLGWLDLSNNQLGAKMTAALLEESSNLRGLAINTNKIGRKGAKSLLTSECSRHVEHLQVLDNNLKPADLIGLLNSEHLERLRTLNVGLNNLEQSSILDMLDTRGFSGLDRIDLRNVSLNDIGLIQAIAEHSACVTMPVIRVSRISAKASSELERVGLANRFEGAGHITHYSEAPGRIFHSDTLGYLEHVGAVEFWS